MSYARFGATQRSSCSACVPQHLRTGSCMAQSDASLDGCRGVNLIPAAQTDRTMSPRRSFRGALSRGVVMSGTRWGDWGRRGTEGPDENEQARTPRQEDAFQPGGLRSAHLRCNAGRRVRSWPWLRPVPQVVSHAEDGHKISSEVARPKAPAARSFLDFADA
jgi:hypothetical protein